MTLSSSGYRIEQFRAVLTRRLGLQFDDTKSGLLAEVFRRRAEANGFVPDRYLAVLEAAPTEEELVSLAEELTIPETYFFRHMEQLRAFRDVVIPNRIQAQKDQRKLRILSAGCASGEEPYSLAMLMRDALPDPRWQVAIEAIDINAAMLAKAARARYSSWSLRETPPEMWQRWFRQSGNEFIVDDAIRRAVKFKSRNLVDDDDAEIWSAESYDVIFCRNVIMYFSPACMQTVIARITRSLAPGGYLFLGHAETLRGLSHDFDLRHTNNAFYYQRKTHIDRSAQPRHGDTPREIFMMPELTTLVDDTESWVDAIGNASERIQMLARQPSFPAAESPIMSRPRWSLGEALDLLRKERFDEACLLVERLPPESASDPDVLLLHAVLLTHGGHLSRAKTMCEKLLALDSTNAGAHYVLALCSEAAGNQGEAVDHNQMAAYLNPAFAMPWVHLGLLHRKAGDCTAAQRELDQALMLLKREDASRLLLFGGGFSRETLIALCEAERAGMGATT